MSPLIGAYYRLLYNLKHHLWWDVPIHNWLVFLLILVMPFAWFGIIPNGRVVTVASVTIIVILLLSHIWTKRIFYVHFRADGGDLPPTDRTPIQPDDKVLLHVSGRFSVEEKEASLTNLIAYYRTFQTREHAILARQTATRFLRGEPPPDKQGMWYMFAKPEDISAVLPGKLYHGSQPRPALRLDYTRLNIKDKPVAARAYLAFESDADRRRVQADLLLDLDGRRIAKIS